MHCPGAAQPIVTFLGVVLERGGQLNDGPTLLHYRLQTTVYNTSTRIHHTFPITAYFKNGQRWANFPPLNVNSHVFLTGRIFGLTKESRQLAIVTDDIHFLPAANHHLPQLLPQQLVNGSESIVGPRGLAPPPPLNQIQTPKMNPLSATCNILSQLEQMPLMMRTTKARKLRGQTQQTKSRPYLVLALPLQRDAPRGQGKLHNDCYRV
ncbi:unnamed protein product [Penicillium nalgiovense]|nr:unnamed protein product [Penicillium nalgiovense]